MNTMLMKVVDRWRYLLSTLSFFTFNFRKRQHTHEAFVCIVLLWYRLLLATMPSANQTKISKYNYIENHLCSIYSSNDSLRFKLESKTKKEMNKTIEVWLFTYIDKFSLDSDEKLQYEYEYCSVLIRKIIHISFVR